MKAECPKCDGIHDHQLDWTDKRCPKCGGFMVEVMEPTKPPKGYGWGV